MHYFQIKYIQQQISLYNSIKDEVQGLAKNFFFDIYISLAQKKSTKIIDLWLKKVVESVDPVSASEPNSHDRTNIELSQQAFLSSSMVPSPDKLHSVTDCVLFFKFIISFLLF